MVLHAIVYGVVQGVGYRKFVKSVGERLNLKGFVRNLPDGTVEVEAEGDEDVLKEFLKRLEEGPSRAYVSQVKYQFIQKNGGYNDFEIRY